MINEPIFLTSIKNAVLQLDDTAEIFLFGSRARGNHKKDSDWDILVLTSKKADTKFQWEVVRKTVALELATNQNISTLVKNKREWDTEYEFTPLYKCITKEGVKI